MRLCRPLDFKRGEEMKAAMILMIVGVMFSACGYIHQQSSIIATPTTPRVVIKEVSVDGKAPVKTENQESFSRPDLTRGYIENQAFPYTPRVWLLAGGKQVLLVGQTEKGPPQVLDWQILEFNLPPGLCQIIVEWWEYLPHYGGWRQIRAEMANIQIARPRRGYWSGYGDSSHYNWSVVIRPDRVLVYEKG